MELAVTLTADYTNPTVGDLRLGEDLQEVVLAELLDEARQRLQVSLNFFKGEWGLNLDAGMPWFQSILVKSPSLTIIRAILTAAIVKVDGVASVESMSLDFDKRARRLSVEFTARTEDGATFSTTEYGPFVVTF